MSNQPTTPAKFNIGDMVHTATTVVNGRGRGSVRISKTPKPVRVAKFHYSYTHECDMWHYMIGKGTTWRAEADLIAADETN